MSDVVKILVAVAFIIFLVIVGPFLTIWALNTLFPVLAIGYTIETWAATVLLGAFLRANVTLKK